jgi:N-acetylmuramoyl-L-alanine amidase/FG-GAP-like repeat
MRRDVQRRSRRALAIKVSVALLIGSAGAVLPRPTVTTEHAMATETRRPVAEGATAQPAPSQPTPTTATPTTPAEAPSAPTPTTAATEPPVTTAPPTTAAPTNPPTPPTVSTPDQPPEQPARVRIAEDTRGFALIGVTLPDAPASPVLVRTATDGGAWGPWTELDFDDQPAGGTPAPVPGAPVPQEPDEDKPGAHSDPYWVGEAGRYELELPADVADVAKVHLVYETSQKVAVAETAPAGADPRGPSIISRASWGARAPRDTPTIASRLQLAVMHHTAGTNSYSAADVPALLRGVQAFHMDARGWDDIGYNFAVDRFGRVWEARAGGTTRAVIGAHAAGFNTTSTGVVVLGNFETASPTSAAVNAVARVMAWKFAVHDVDPRRPVAFRAGEGSPRYPPGTVVTLNRIVGHRDVGLTACPGRTLYPHLGPIRTSVGRAWRTLAAPGLALVGNFALSAPDDVFLRQPGVLADRLLTASAGRYTSRRLFTVNGSYRPLVGDFDRNGFDDILWYAAGTAADGVWHSRGDLTFASRTTGAVNGSYRPFTGDFDGDGDDDVFWYAPGSARDFVWWATGSNFRAAVAPGVTGSYRVAAGDFDGDGDDDIFWHGPGSVRDGFWASGGGTFRARTAPQVSGSFVPVAGDYDGSGRDDVFFYALGSSREVVWLSTGGFAFSARRTTSVSGTYRVVRAADLNGDGRDELLWYASPGGDFVWWHGTGVLDRSSPTNVPLR